VMTTPNDIRRTQPTVSVVRACLAGQTGRSCLQSVARPTPCIPMSVAAAVAAPTAMLDLNIIRYLRCSLGPHPPRLRRQKSLRQRWRPSIVEPRRRRTAYTARRVQQTALDTQDDVQSILIFLLAAAHGPDRTAACLPPHQSTAC